jgi:choice-of-anchor B domain-containing protein
MVCAVVLGLVGSASAQHGSMNVNLYHQLTLNDLSANYAMDCWGYVSDSGREYALVGLSTGTAFVEITDPSNPVIVEQIAHPRGGKDIKVYQDYAYATTDSGPLQVIDMTDIDNGNVTLARSVSDRAHNLVINEDSGFLYTCDSGGLHALDLSDPTNPTPRGSGWNGECHDAQVVNYTEGPYAGKEIAFVFAGWSNNLDIVDVTNKSNTQLMSRSGYAGSGYTHNGWLSADRQYLYLSDELDEINGDTNVTLTFVWNVADLTNPSLIDTFTTGFAATDHNLYVRDGFVFQANYKSGMFVFDIQADPVAPPMVGYYDTYPSSDANGYDGGAWTTYPFFPSGTVITSDQDGGLFIFDPSDATRRGCARSPEWICDGDTDGDGQVNPVDSGLVQAAFGSTDEQDLCNYDVDCDGQINPVDSGIVQSLFGTCEEPRDTCP